MENRWVCLCVGEGVMLGIICRAEENITLVVGQLEYQVPVGEVEVRLRKFVLDYLVVVITHYGRDWSKT